MTLTSQADVSASSPQEDLTNRANAASQLPIWGLLALAMAAFITLLTEVMPAGLLPQMSASLGVSESMAGQLITIYAAGSLLTAIPLMSVSQSLRRRPLLLTAIVGFAIVNTVTAISDNYMLTLVARFFAGVFGGLVWALLAGYAARMAPLHLSGRAIAIMGIGAPLAFSLGVPAGTFVGGLVGWRLAFGVMSVLAVVLIGWVLARVPDFAGQPAGKRLSLGQVFGMPGIRPVLFVTFAFVLAHNILYTYIAPFLAPAGLVERVDGVLLVFGLSGLAGLWIAGALIDRWLRELVLASIAAFMAAVLALGLLEPSPAVVYVAVGPLGTGVRRRSDPVPDGFGEDGGQGGGCRAGHDRHRLESGYRGWRRHRRRAAGNDRSSLVSVGDDGRAGSDVHRRLRREATRIFNGRAVVSERYGYGRCSRKAAASVRRASRDLVSVRVENITISVEGSGGRPKR